MFIWMKTYSPGVWLLPLRALPLDQRRDTASIRAGILSPAGRRLGRTGQEDPQGD